MTRFARVQLLHTRSLISVTAARYGGRRLDKTANESTNRRLRSWQKKGGKKRRKINETQLRGFLVRYRCVSGLPVRAATTAAPVYVNDQFHGYHYLWSIVASLTSSLRKPRLCNLVTYTCTRYILAYNADCPIVRLHVQFASARRAARHRFARKSSLTKSELNEGNLLDPISKD